MLDLTLTVKESFHLDPFSSCVFVFCNRKKDKLKCLFWDVNGFWLMTKRLEKGQFDWPDQQTDTMGISYRQLRWLLDGLSIWQNEAYRERAYRTII